MRNMNLFNLAHPSKFSFLLPFAAAAVACILTLESGCAFLSPLKHPKKDRFQCEVAALAPVVNEVLDPEALLRDLYTGKADLGAVLRNLTVTPAEVETLFKALQACSPAPEAVSGGSPS
jgi:hypothetical protein